MLPEQPMDLFLSWFEEARKQEPWDGRAMVLSTVGTDGFPSARVVLMRGADAAGFRFFTNYESRKGRELRQNPKCALVFWWPTQVRQVRVEGIVEQLDAAESDAYFAARPRESRIGAWASAQSSVIESRRALEEQAIRLASSFEGREVPRPRNWGGYLIVPLQFEFWQGGEARLHDRFRYSRDRHDDCWTIARLAP